MPDDMDRLRAAFREIYPDDIADAICEWVEAALALGEAPFDRSSYESEDG